MQTEQKYDSESLKKKIKELKHELVTLNCILSFEGFYALYKSNEKKMSSRGAFEFVNDLHLTVIGWKSFCCYDSFKKVLDHHEKNTFENTLKEVVQKALPLASGKKNDVYAKLIFNANDVLTKLSEK
jgi:hypothetical protein